MKDDLILEVQKLDRRATPGPWVYSEGLLDISGYIPIELEPLSKENGEFIARSRTLLPILCDLIKQTWEWDMYQCAIRDREKLKRKLVAAQNAQPLDEWCEDIGCVLWWEFPITEPPYCGSPLDADWPGYHTHWTSLIMPQPPKEALP